MKENKEYYVIDGPNTILNRYGKKVFNIPDGQFAVAAFGTNLETGMLDMQTELSICIKSRGEADKLAKSMTTKHSSKLISYNCPNNTCDFHGSINSKYLDSSDRIRICPECNERICLKW